MLLLVTESAPARDLKRPSPLGEFTAGFFEDFRWEERADGGALFGGQSQIRGLQVGFQLRQTTDADDQAADGGVTGGPGVGDVGAGHAFLAREGGEFSQAVSVLGCPAVDALVAL